MLIVKGRFNAFLHNIKCFLNLNKYKMYDKKIILHLCADIGSDSRFYNLDEDYEVIKVGIDIGVQNFTYQGEVYGVIANPVCTEFSTVNGFDKVGDLEKGMFLVNHCKRIIEECNPTFWVIENPANGRLKEMIGKPNFVYQPWEYGSPWTKKTALWGKFNIPEKLFNKWEDVEKNPDLYIRPGRKKPSLALLHKSAKDLIPEFDFAYREIMTDTDIRSMCSQGFAKAFYEANM